MLKSVGPARRLEINKRHQLQKKVYILVQYFRLYHYHLIKHVKFGTNLVLQRYKSILLVCETHSSN